MSDAIISVVRVMLGCGVAVFVWGTLGAIVGGYSTPSENVEGSVRKSRFAYLCCSIAGAMLTVLSWYCLRRFTLLS